MYAKLIHILYNWLPGVDRVLWCDLCILLMGLLRTARNQLE